MNKSLKDTRCGEKGQQDERGGGGPVQSTFWAVGGASMLCKCLERWQRQSRMGFEAGQVGRGQVIKSLECLAKWGLDLIGAGELLEGSEPRGHW